ncbi:MAG: hypothetical protein TECD_00043 [Hyphomicrobiaceae bacterium hypho_1]
MEIFIIGLVIFFSIHSIAILGSLKEILIDKIGDLIYKVVFSIGSAIGLLLVIYGYAELRSNGTGNEIFWVTSTWMKHFVLLSMLPSSIFIVAAYIPSRITKFVRHPMLVAIKIWASSHLIVNGDLASIILFSSFLCFAVIDIMSLKKRSGGVFPTTNFLCNKYSGLIGDVAVISTGLILYMFMLFYGHYWLVGVTLLNG